MKNDNYNRLSRELDEFASQNCSIRLTEIYIYLCQTFSKENIFPIRITSKAHYTLTRCNIFSQLSLYSSTTQIASRRLAAASDCGWFAIGQFIASQLAACTFLYCRFIAGHYMSDMELSLAEYVPVKGRTSIAIKSLIALFHLTCRGE